ncbi:MAG: hypothetical protein J5601_05895 [Elusimicrobiaceae bacterium]|nr:hypothetical protein [Elusimicrobiaceae bacterium]
MKKLLALFFVCLLPCFSFGEGKGLLRIFRHRPEVKVSLPSAGELASNDSGFFNTLRRLVSNQPKVEPQIVFNPDMVSLLKEIYAVQPALPKKLSPEVALIAQISNHPCLLDTHLPYLYVTDTESKFFKGI